VNAGKIKRHMENIVQNKNLSYTSTRTHTMYTHQNPDKLVWTSKCEIKPNSPNEIAHKRLPKHQSVNHGYANIITVTTSTKKKEEEKDSRQSIKIKRQQQQQKKNNKKNNKKNKKKR
jgi:ribosomal protein L3